MGSAQSARHSASARDGMPAAQRGAGSQLRRWRILSCLGATREEVASQRDPFVALPHGVAVAIFSLLPYTSRIRCTAVCRAWRETLRDGDAWLNADFHGLEVSSPRSSSVYGLRSLHVTFDNCRRDPDALRHSQTLDYLRLMAAVSSLHTLHLYAEDGVAHHELRTLLELPALSSLSFLEADVRVERMADARAVLRGEPPFERLHVRSLHFDSIDDWSAEALDIFRADLAACEHAPRLCCPQQLPHHRVVLDKLVDAALELRLKRLGLRCTLMGTCAPAIARVLDGGAVTELSVKYGGTVIAFAPPNERPSISELADGEADSAAVLVRALKENTSLTSLTLDWTGVSVSGGNMGTCIVTTGPLLLRALAAHPRLRVLVLRKNLVDRHAPIPFFVAVAELIAANAPALQELSLSGFALWESTLRPLLEALPRNTHLRVLRMHRTDVGLSFARTTLLPAVKACASLRRLECSAWVRVLCEELNYELGFERIQRDMRDLHEPLGGRNFLWYCCCCCCCNDDHPDESRLRYMKELYRTLRDAESLVASRGGPWL